jgi:hypothetical protein
MLHVAYNPHGANHKIESGIVIKILLANPPSTEIGVPNMPSLKAKKLRKLPQKKYF